MIADELLDLEEDQPLIDMDTAQFVAWLRQQRLNQELTAHSFKTNGDVIFLAERGDFLFSSRKEDFSCRCF